MWISPISDEMLAKHNLVQKKCNYMGKKYKDVLIYKNGYKLSELDREFISNVIKNKRCYEHE